MIQNLVFLALSLTQQEFATLPEFDHSQDWRTTQTEHFSIHYLPEIAEPISHLVEMVEPIHAKITSKYKWVPKGKVHVVVTDNMDESNGLSTPIPYNSIYLYIAPPTDDSALDYYDDWLKLLFTHEFTHTVHIDMVGGLNTILRNIFGRIIVPNGAQQQWAIEGLAELEETDETTKGRGRSPFVEMFIRTVSLENKFLGIDRATYWQDSYPFGNAAYFYGIKFYQYLVKRYGREKITELTKSTSDSIIPAFFNFKTKKVFGKSFSRLWQEWRNEESKKWTEFASVHQQNPQGQPLEEPGYRLEGIPVWADGGKTLYAGVISPESQSQLRKYTWDAQQKVKSEKLNAGPVPSRFSLEGKYLFYSKNGFVSRFKSTSDLFAFDLKEKKSIRLTRGLRVRDPIVVDGGFIATRNNHLKASIIKIKRPAFEKDDFEALEKPDYEVLFEAQGFDTIAKPALSPNKQFLVFSMRRENEGRHLYLLDLRSKEVRTLTSGSFDEYYPTWSEGGGEIYFQSARPLDKDSQGPRVFNIYALRLSDGSIRSLTQVLTGAAWPVPYKNTLAFGYFRSTGYEIRTLQIAPEKTAELVSAPSWAKVYQKGSDAKVTSISSTSYDSGQTLLPHYVLPIILYSETDSIFGAAIGSYDPLQRHMWSGLGYYISGPSSPGGAISYAYNSNLPVTFFAGASAGIQDYGNVLVVSDGTNLYLSSQRYYERLYSGYLGLSGRVFTTNGFSGLSLGTTSFFELRQPLLDLPAGLLSGKQRLRNAPTGELSDPLLSRPEEGMQAGQVVHLTYQTPGFKSPQGESFSSGLKITLSAEGSKFFADDSNNPNAEDIKQLTTLSTAKSFLELADGHYLAANINAGLQWLDPLYQRTFLLGGSFGEGPFTSVNRRSYPLRGLPVSYLRGEGLMHGSLEYRLRLLRYLPGWGTAPIWFKNLHLAFFTDAGQTYEWKDSKTIFEYLGKREMQKFSPSRFTQSAGAELRSHISLSYAPPLLFRLGWGRVIFLQGENFWDSEIDEIYFAAGASF